MDKKGKQWIFIGLVYVIAVFAYAFAASRMSVPVHLKVDEDLYLSLAKSFHQTGSFMKGYEYSNYNCVLYSMLISVGYYFYTPETILFTLRMINVLVMCSAVFPVFLLAKRMLPLKKAMMVSAFCLLIPDMIDTCYLMQEVLFYPVLMWCFYFVYRDLEDRRLVNGFSIMAAVMMTAAFFVKTNGLILIAAYALLILVVYWKDKRKGILKCLLIAGVWCVLVVLAELGILFANGGNQGENHYASQIMALFPLSGYTIVAGLSGMLYYIVFFLFCVGILPAVLPFVYRKSYSETDGRFLLFTYVATALMLAEIVATIFLTEEAGNLIPHKFLFRYFFGFGIPFLLLLLKVPESEWKGKKILFLSYGGTGIYIAAYYAIVKTATRTAIMDSHITLLLENANKYVIPGFPVYCGLGLAVLSVGFLHWAFRKREPAFLTRVFWKAAWVVAVVLCVINLIQHPYYSNQIVDGEVKEKDFIALADYLGKKDIKVYYLNDKLDNNALLYGYIWQDYQWIRETSEIAVQKQTDECVLVTEVEQYEAIEGWRRADLWIGSVELWIIENKL